ncbi:MAG TPA: histidine phosphatase family protein [Spirochaetota bacterium]|nr:histidine phosphatase family protein [Spirochaetota bacterium]
MKQLILMRHAKSDWDNSLSDIDRPLSERGKREAPVVGKFLRKEKIIPDKLISSPSQRTRETLRYLMKELKEQINVEFNDIIYENIPKKIVELISKTEENIKTLMILGHNPSMEGLYQSFSGILIDDNDICEKFVTSAISLFEFDIKEWGEIVKAKGKLVFFKSPKEL